MAVHGNGNGGVGGEGELGNRDNIQAAAIFQCDFHAFLFGLGHRWTCI